MKILKSILNYIPLATFIIFVVTDGIFSLTSALIFVISTIGLLINWKREKTEMKNWENSSLQNWIKRARRSSFSFFIMVSLWYNRDIKIGICGGKYDSTCRWNKSSSSRNHPFNILEGIASCILYSWFHRNTHARSATGVFEKQDEQRNKALYAYRRKTNRGCFCNKGFNRGSLYSSRYAKHGLWNEIVTIRSRPMYGYPYAVDSWE